MYTAKILLSIAMCIFLAGCAIPLNEQQALALSPSDLCTHEMNFGYSQAAQNAIVARKINCEKVILAEAKNVIPTMNSAELCTSEYLNRIPQIYPMIQKEIAKRRLDCISYMQAQQQTAIMQQQVNAQRQYQEEQLRLQRYQQQLNSFKTHNNGSCSSISIPPIPSIGCKSVCIDGRWSQVC